MKQRPGKQGPGNQKSLRLYALLQSLALLLTWSWFAALWSLAFFNFDLGNMEWWLLVGSACAALYGVRPNLERAIDTAWLQGIADKKALAERFAQLKPVKRRVFVIFTLIVLALFAAVFVYALFSGLIR